MVKERAKYCKARKQLVGLALGNLYIIKSRKSRLVARDQMSLMLLLPPATWHTEIDLIDADTFGAAAE